MAERQAAINAITANVQTSIQGGNGADIYSNERAMFGYVAAHERLQMAPAILNELPAPPNIDLIALGSLNGIQDFLGINGAAHRTANAYTANHANDGLNFIKLFVMNFRSLVVGNTPADDAGLISLLRARWCILGCLFKTQEARAVTFEEVENWLGNNPTVMAGDIAALYDIDANKPALTWYNAHGELLRWTIKYAENIWGMVEFVFRTRGHHYKQEFEANYKKVWKSISDNATDFPVDLNLAAVMRTAIHPFGIRALPVMSAHFISHGKIGNGLIVRFSGAPNGTAVFTTTTAGVNAIATETWYARFTLNYANQIAFANIASEAVKNNKYSFHLAASLYGLPRATMINVNGVNVTLAEAEQRVISLSPFLQGFISFTREQAIRSNAGTFAMSAAKVLEKRASVNPMQMIRISALLEQTVNAVRDAKDTAVAMTSAFPSLPAAAANQ